MTEITYVWWRSKSTGKVGENLLHHTSSLRHAATTWAIRNSKVWKIFDCDNQLINKIKKYTFILWNQHFLTSLWILRKSRDFGQMGLKSCSTPFQVSDSLSVKWVWEHYHLGLFSLRISNNRSEASSPVPGIQWILNKELLRNYYSSIWSCKYC